MWSVVVAETVLCELLEVYHSLFLTKTQFVCSFICFTLSFVIAQVSIKSLVLLRPSLFGVLLLPSPSSPPPFLGGAAVTSS